MRCRGRWRSGLWRRWWPRCSTPPPSTTPKHSLGLVPSALPPASPLSPSATTYLRSYPFSSFSNWLVLVFASISVVYLSFARAWRFQWIWGSRTFECWGMSTSSDVLVTRQSCWCIDTEISMFNSNSFTFLCLLVSSKFMLFEIWYTHFFVEMYIYLPFIYIYGVIYKSYLFHLNNKTM